MTAKYSDAGSKAKDVQRLQADCAEAVAQKEAALQELRLSKEAAQRAAAEAREAWETRIAALTDKAFKLADPEVHVYVHCICKAL